MSGASSDHIVKQFCLLLCSLVALFVDLVLTCVLFLPFSDLDDRTLGLHLVPACGSISVLAHQVFEVFVDFAVGVSVSMGATDVTLHLNSIFQGF